MEREALTSNLGIYQFATTATSKVGPKGAVVIAGTVLAAAAYGVKSMAEDAASAIQERRRPKDVPGYRESSDRGSTAGHVAPKASRRTPGCGHLATEDGTGPSC